MYIPRRLFPVLPLLFFVLPAFGCASLGPAAGAAPMRSPTLDYAPPPVETADGQILGADGMSVEDKLRTSPRAGSGGLTPAAVPALIEKPRPEPVNAIDDPLCKVLGLNDNAWNQRCAGTASPEP